ncbi:MAG: MBOAT family protein [Myxococcales bacterium]|nr:MBOAT family protein [Myxococcales bacterium]
MSLLSATYGLLVLIAVGLCAITPLRLRGLLITGLSLLFYAWGSLPHAALIVLLGSLVFLIGERLHLRRSPALFVCAVLLCVAVLCGFKYSVLLLQTLAELWPRPDLARSLSQMAHALSLSLQIPLGISFFTFEFVHYLTDIYQGKIPRPSAQTSLAKRLCDFFLFALFFPTLLAGPIKRYQQFSPMEAPLWQRKPELAEGLWRILIGLAKKVLIADSLATITLRLKAPELVTPPGLWLAMYAYAAQIYADFSGYSDVAIGVSLLLGYRIPENFRNPYVARSLQDFWRRWHISLSSWIRDYLFIPLGGSHVPPWRAMVNLLLVMALCGLWHGAAGHFVVWGIWHGAGLALEQLARKLRGKTTASPSALSALLGWLWTFHFVCVGWILFAAPSLKAALTALARMLWLVR